jgi:hypothetical protein
MDCLACGGACCETMILPVGAVRFPSPDAKAWFMLHGSTDGSRVELECRCSALTPDGKCGIYTSLERPKTCADFRPGERGCIETVRRRRTPEQYILIRGAADPERIHG